MITRERSSLERLLEEVVLPACILDNDQLTFEAVKQLVGTETAQRLRLRKVDIEDEPLTLASPTDVDVYGDDAVMGEPDDDDQ